MPIRSLGFTDLVTVGSIRWRILKAAAAFCGGGSGSCYSGFDPMEDTESHKKRRRGTEQATVTVGSIRWRILKDRPAATPDGSPASYSGFDPMEDTESVLGRAVRGLCAARLQWVRSDGGY